MKYIQWIKSLGFFLTGGIAISGCLLAYLDKYEDKYLRIGIITFLFGIVLLVFYFFLWLILSLKMAKEECASIRKKMEEIQDNREGLKEQLEVYKKENQEMADTINTKNLEIIQSDMLLNQALSSLDDNQLEKIVKINQIKNFSSSEE